VHAEVVDLVVTGPGMTPFSARVLTEDVDPRTLLFRLAD